MSLSPTDVSARVHAFTDDVLGDHDASAVADLIRSGQISATEAVEAAIARSSAVESRLTALQRTDFERARTRARTVTPGPEHPLAGVPAAFKDNVPVAGLPMTNGSPAPPRRPVAKNDGVVDQILQTGVIPIGTTRMPEFGWTPTTERADGTVVHNPWHTDYSAGGSSGGAAAYVAAGVLPLAHGNDGGGSIRIPAAACGLVGHKATRGRLRLGESSKAMPVRLITDGVLTRSVRDVATFYAAAERTWCNGSLPPLGLVDRPIERSLRIGLLVDSPIAPATDRDTRTAVENLAGTLEDLGHRVEPFVLDLPENFTDDFIDYWALLAKAVSTLGPVMFGAGFDRAALDPMTRGLAARAGRRLHRMPGVIRRLRASGDFYDEQMTGWDLVLSPVLTHTTPRLGVLDATAAYDEVFPKVRDYVGFTPLHNVTGAPSISLPTGQTSDGLPLGVMLSAARGADALLLQTALQVEAAVPFRRIGDDAG